MSVRRIGILTGGGDVPGLNSVIKGVVYRASEMDMDVIGLRRGWEALTHVNFTDRQSKERYILPLNRSNTRTIDRTGGTFLHTSRTNPAKMQKVPEFLDASAFPASKVKNKDGEEETRYDMTSQALANIEALGIDYLVTIGGDDTLSYSARLHKENVPVVGIPKTMDNDVRNTEYCIGFSTAITRAMDAIGRQRTTVGSHERIGIFRIFGRDAGYTALYTAYVTSIRCCIPEYRFDLGRLIELLMADKASNPSNYSLVVLSEGTAWEGYRVQHYGPPDAFGHRKKMSIAEALADQLQDAKNEETVVSDLTYDLRGGEPDFLDKMVATTFANMALEAVQEGKSGVMTAVVEGCYSLESIPDPKLGPRKVDVERMYNIERYRPNYGHKLGLPIFLTRS
jgi:ATP-dependent phosphofructokinase / diphosphate-dependent phosphofructokinase